jgi:glyoxylase I family protein
MVRHLTLDRSSRPVVNRMDHVHLTVADLARSMEWYEQVFDFSVRWSNGKTAHVGTDRFYVALTQHDGIRPARGDDSCRARIARLGFTTTDPDAFSERLLDSGIASGARRFDGESFTLHDPDGNAIEVIAYRDGFVSA